MTKSQKKQRKTKEFQHREPLFDMGEVIETFKNVQQPQNEEQRVGVLLRAVQKACRDSKVSEARIVEMEQTEKGYKFTVQGKQNGKNVQADVNVEGASRQPTYGVYQRFQTEEQFRESSDWDWTDGPFGNPLPMRGGR